MRKGKRSGWASRSAWGRSPVFCRPGRPRVVRCAKPSDMNSRAAERRSHTTLKHATRGENNMRLRTYVILVTLTLFAVASTASATMPRQPKPKQPKAKADAISSAWDAVLTTDDKPVQLTLTLKLEGDKMKFAVRPRGGKWSAPRAITQGENRFDSSILALPDGSLI